MRRLIVFGLLVTACVSKPVATPGAVSAPSDSEYRALLTQHTGTSNQYSGFYQTFQADATLMTTELETALLKKRAEYLQWDQATYNVEREKALQESSAYSKVILRFFSPDRDYDDLSKGAKSIWRVYLDFNGNRFEGKVRKMNEKMVELQRLYPNFDRFSTPYEITFNVPMTTLEQGSCTVVLTSSLGTAEFRFPTGK